MKIKEYGSGKEGDVANDLGVERRVIGKGRGSGHGPIVNIVIT